MHEHLTYFSSSTGQYIHLGDKYGSPIMYNNLRNYSASYNSSNGRITSWNNKTVTSKSFTVKWILDTEDQNIDYRRTFQNLIDLDIEYNMPGRLYFEDQYYINCFIYAQEMSDTLIDGRYSVSKFNVVTEDPYFYKDTELRSVPKRDDGDVEPNTGMVDGCVGCELEMVILANGNTTPVCELYWYDENKIRAYIYTYGLNNYPILPNDALEIDTYKKTVFTSSGNNLFRYRIKSGRGTFATPGGFPRYVYLGSGGSNSGVYLTIRGKYRTVPASQNYGKPLSTAVDYGPAAIPEWI